ncbi:MAG: hypothetical protein ACK566_09080 [Bacteroidota bacterium]
MHAISGGRFAMDVRGGRRRKKKEERRKKEEGRRKKEEERRKRKEERRKKEEIRSEMKPGVELVEALLNIKSLWGYLF